MDEGEALNIVLVGDSDVGKSALISACHVQNPILDEEGITLYRREHVATMTTYMPTSFQSYRTKFRLFGHLPMSRSKKREFLTRIIEVGGSGRYDDVRPLAYMNCDVFLVCFDLTNSASLDNVKSKWLPEIKHYEPETPVMLLGTKADLKTKRQVMAGNELHKLSKTLGLARYIEVSCYNPRNEVEILFSTAVELAHEHKEKKTSELTHEQEGEPAVESVEFDVNELDTLSDPPEFTKNGSTTLSGDWHDTLNNNMLTDVVLKFSADTPDIKTHKFVLSLASKTFQKILKDSTSMCFECEEPSKNFMNSATKYLYKVDGDQLEVTFDASVDHKVFVCILAWMYTGKLDIPDKLDDSFVESLHHIVEELEILPLTELCKQLNGGKEKAKDMQQTTRAMSTEHEILQNDGNLASLQEGKGNKKSHENGPTKKSKSENAKLEALIAYIEMWRKADKLLQQDGCPTDTVLMVKDKPISVHRVVMATRSPMLAAMLEGSFKEKDSVEIKLPGVSPKHFHAILEFMYTDKCVLDKANIPGILELADRFCIQSLIDRCEEFLIAIYSTYDYKTLALHGKEQVRKIMKSIYLAKTFNASFLHKWCLHFVATNYTFFEREKNFDIIWAENEEYMERNRWPSRKCSQLLREYKKSRQTRCCVM